MRGASRGPIFNFLLRSDNFLIIPPTYVQYNYLVIYNFNVNGFERGIRRASPSLISNMYLCYNREREINLFVESMRAKSRPIVPPNS